MNYFEVLPLSKTGTEDAVFTYESEESTAVGSIVSVPLRNRFVRGMITAKTPKPKFTTRPIKKIQSEPVLSEAQLKLAQKISDYYLCPLGDVINTMLPFEFGKKRRVEYKEPDIKNLEKPLRLTPDQREIFENIKKGGEGSKFLLFGVTGSGKTEIYLQLVEDALKKGQSSIILVPEIALTPQAMERFTNRFGNQVAVWHSNLKETEKYTIWQKIKSGEKKVVLGARSAIFTPVSNLGYVIIDEEHEGSYKQDQNPRYQTKKVAEWLVELTGAKLIAGSATPKIETFQKVKNNEYFLYSLNKRIVQDSMPPVKVVDLRNEFKKGNKSIFSEELFENIKQTLAENKQIILFVNRRGASTFVVCRDCGYVAECPHCEIPLTFHLTDSKSGKLHCHHCGYTSNVPLSCPNCKSLAIRYFGLGTQRVELEVTKLFPKAKVIRMDRDTTKKRGSHEEIYKDFSQKKFDILIGTQMIAKGWDLPNVALIGVISADTMLNLPDFGSSERTFSLLTQVAGRTGRGYHPGKVIIQTYAPENYALKYAKNHDYLGFFEREIKERQKYTYPPFVSLIKLTYGAKSAEKAHTEALRLSEALEKALSGVKISGPSEAFLPKLNGNYRYQLVLKLKESQLSKTLSVIKNNLKSCWTVDVNPDNLL